MSQRPNRSRKRIKKTSGGHGDINRLDAYDGNTVKSRNATETQKNGSLLKEAAKRDANAECTMGTQQEKRRSPQPPLELLVQDSRQVVVGAVVMVEER